MHKSVPQRKTFFVAVEGQSEQSFIRWLQELSAQIDLHIHFDVKIVNGGSYQTMFERTILHRDRKQEAKTKFQASYLFCDIDRKSGEDWDLELFKQKALSNNLNLMIQNPNFEGLLYRMIPGKEQHQPNAGNTLNLLRSVWPDYEKPANALWLRQKYTIEQLLHLAKFDQYLKQFLHTVGFI